MSVQRFYNDVQDSIFNVYNGIDHEIQCLICSAPYYTLHFKMTADQSSMSLCAQTTTIGDT